MHEGTSLRKKADTRPWRRGALTALAALVTVAASLAVTAGVARADGSPPPAATFPPAGETVPPAEAITNPAICSAWYQQSSYGGVWPTGSTWWEHSCTSSWPQVGEGATNADWGGEYIWISYYYWDGSKPVLYGQWFWDGYFDSMFFGTNCWYWSNLATNEGEGPLYCSDNYWLGLSEIGG